MMKEADSFTKMYRQKGHGAIMHALSDSKHRKITFPRVEASVLEVRKRIDLNLTDAPYSKLT